MTYLKKIILKFIFNIFSLLQIVIKAKPEKKDIFIDYNVIFKQIFAKTQLYK